MGDSWPLDGVNGVNMRYAVLGFVTGALAIALLNAYLCYRWLSYMNTYGPIEDYVNDPRHHD